MNKILPTGVNLMNTIRNNGIGGIDGVLSDTPLANILGNRGDQALLKLPLTDRNLLMNGPMDLLGGLPGVGLTGGLGNGALLGGDLAKVQDLLASSLSMLIPAPLESIRMFLEMITSPLSIAHPMKNLMSTDIRDAVDQTLGLRMISDMTAGDYDIFSSVLNDITGPLGGRFMERSSTDPSGILGKVKTELLDHELLNGPLKSLRGPSRLYFNDIIPKINSMAILNTVLNDTSSQLAPILGLTTLPVQLVADLVHYKLALVSSVAGLAEGVVVPVADIASDLVGLASDLVGDVINLVAAVPKLGIDIVFQVLMTVGDIVNGVIDIKFGAIEFIARLPFELIEIIIDTPVSIISNLGIGNIDVLSDFWREVQELLGIYTRYNDALGLPAGALPLRDFAMMSRDLMTRSEEGMWGDEYGDVYGLKKRRN